MTTLKLSTIALFAVALTGCSGGNETGTDSAQSEPAVSTKPAPTAAAESPGKITAPVSLSYQIIGNPVVGRPVAINILVMPTGSDGPVTLRYRVIDESSMSFPAAQAAEVRLNPAQNEAQRRQQLTVVPQREGRLYLNVSAEVTTANGSMFKSLAVPVQVGSAPEGAERNGELVEGPDGEQVISMPAEESQ